MTFVSDGSWVRSLETSRVRDLEGTKNEPWSDLALKKQSRLTPNASSEDIQRILQSWMEDSVLLTTAVLLHQQNPSSWMKPYNKYSDWHKSNGCPEGFHRSCLPWSLGGDFDYDVEIPNWVRSRISIENGMGSAPPVQTNKLPLAPCEPLY